MTEGKYEPGTAVHVMKFNEMPIGDFRTQWKELDLADQGQLKGGLLDESLNYEPTEEQIAAARARNIAVPGGPDYVCP